MQTQFVKEGMTTYLMIPFEGTWADTYGEQLCMRCEVPHFLQYEARSLNGSVMLYYRLTHHTTLHTVMGHLPFTCDRVREMLGSVAAAICMPDEYFLEPNGILWDSRYIFVNVETGQLQFCYYPGSHDCTGTPAALVTELLQYVDKKQDAAVMQMMRFYDLVTDPALDAVRISSFWRIEETNGANSETNGQECGENVEESEKNKKRNSGMLLRVLIVLTGAADVGLLLLFAAQQLTVRDMWFFLAGILALLILIVVHAQKGEETPDEMMEAYFADLQAEEARDGLHKETERSLEVIGETTVLSEQEEACLIEEENKGPWVILSMEKNRYPEISLDGSSLVIGSMREGCGYVLRERGVSRLHAKILEREDGIYVIDLNSTNGTWLNGESVEAGKEYRLEEGDLLAFAQCQFIVTRKERKPL